MNVFFIVFTYDLNKRKEFETSEQQLNQTFYRK